MAINLEEIKKEKPIRELVNFSIISFNKPAGWTSFDVVNFVRRKLAVFGVKKCGHLGTLDPEVTGVLPIVVGNACKIQDLFMHKDKTYIGVMKLHKSISRKELESAMKDFTGKISQLPPRKSRVKRQIREREIYEFKILDFDEKNREAEFIAKVEAGTYIRKLVHDLGEKLGIGAHMSSLRRIQAGIFSEKDKNFCDMERFSKAVDALTSTLEEEKLLREILTPAEIIERFLPVLHVNEESLSKLKNGSPIFESMLIEKKDVKKAEHAKSKAKNSSDENERFAVFCGEKLVEIAVSTKQFNNPEIIAKPESVLV